MAEHNVPCIKLTAKPVGEADEIECPFCHSILLLDEDQQLIVYSDYVDHPMVWCDECGARAFLDLRVWSRLCPNWDDRREVSHFANTDIREIPLLYIKRVVGSNMFCFHSEVPLTRAQMDELMDDYHLDDPDDPVDIRKNDEIVKKFNLRVEDKTRENMNVSFEVNSFNVMQPNVPYHPKMSTAHDGVYIWCLVTMPDGTDKILKYWGD